MADLLRFWHPVLASKRLRGKPVGVTIDGRRLVLFRDAQGTAAALDDACPHRGAPLSAGRMRPDGRLMCGFHGWHFDGEGRGACPSQPGLSCETGAYRVVEKYGALWVANRDVTPDSMPALVDEGDALAGHLDTPMPAPLELALDVFSENEHVPRVHTRLGWDEAELAKVLFHAENFDDRTEVEYRAPQRLTWLAPLLLLRPGDWYRNAWVTRFDPLRTRYDISWTASGPDGDVRPVRTRSTIFMVPETPGTCRFHTFVTYRIESKPLRLLAPVVSRVALFLAWWEVRDDQRYLPTIADVGLSLEGRRLDRFDKPVIHNRRLLRERYFARGADEPVPLGRPRK